MARARSSGFTLVEMVGVLIIVGILAVAALPRFFDKQIFENRGFHDELLSALRYAQKSAVAQRRSVCVAFGANSATLRIASASSDAPVANRYTCDKDLRSPTGAAPFVVTAPSGVSFAVAPTSFLFNSLGQPVNAAGVAVATQTIQVSDTGRSIIIETDTGYVHQ